MQGPVGSDTLAQTTKQNEARPAGNSQQTYGQGVWGKNSLRYDFPAAHQKKLHSLPCISGEHDQIGLDD